MTLPRNPRSHFLLPDHITKTELFRGVGNGKKIVIPAQPRDAHGAHLRGNFATLKTILEEASEEQKKAGWGNGFGFSIKFTSFPDIEFALESFDLKSHGIELLNVRSVVQISGYKSKQIMVAAVWLPYGKLGVFEKKIKDYLEYRRDKNGDALDNQKFLDAIQDVRASLIEDIWTDDSPLPHQDQEMRFEVWISKSIDEAKLTEQNSKQKPKPFFVNSVNRIDRFRKAAVAAGMWVGEKALDFPERAVLLVRGTLAQLQSSAYLLGHLAELRRAPETADFFMQLPRAEQQIWIAELIQRTTFAASSEFTPHVCVLDTGCLQGHPLISQALDQADLHAVNDAWGEADRRGHGTGQTGLAIWGDLTHAFEGTEPIYIAHRAESVKLLPDKGENNVEHYGALTRDAVNVTELKTPFRRRLFSMAVTSTATTRRGSASAWSAEIDALTSDYAGDGSRRLMLISAGNVDPLVSREYPDLNSTTSVEDPAQAWNALSIGAIAKKTSITEVNTDSYSLVAMKGELSPYSSTSWTWEKSAPFKPEVVFEGGNVGDDGTIVSRFDSLDLITAHHETATRLLATSYGTSAATALASRFCARLMAYYPGYWPETIRALMVHSAIWTPALLRQYSGTSKSQVENRLRHCGWGEPDLDRALHSGADSLTLVAQCVLQPFQRKPKTLVEGKSAGGNITARDMHLHQLPWPTESLSQLFESDVELRVTLSYFVEPNPGQRGKNSRFSYQSFGLRFAVQQPLELVDDFRKRINKLALEEESDEQEIATKAASEKDDPNWMLGKQKRFRGSLHHDRLVCGAAELAARAHIAVFPVGGWWKNREALQQFERKARYSLLVSIKTPETAIEIDLCNEVEQILVKVAVEIESTE